jgi:hypothetical protein
MGRQVPTNPKMFKMFVVQAKARYRTFPSAGASAWVHKQYVEHGGKFVDSEELKRKERVIEHYKKHAGEHRAKSEKDKKSDKDDKKKKSDK